MGSNLTNEYTGCWVMASDAGNKYVGRVCINKIPIDKIGALKSLADLGYLELSPALQYISQLVPQQTEAGVVLGRDSAVVPYDLVLEEDNVAYIRPSAVMFFDDLSGSDRASYETLINRCGDIMLQSRAAKSGITLTKVSINGVQPAICNK